MIDTVIFDMDGVLIDSEPIHQEIEQSMFKQLGLSIPKGKHDKFLGTSDFDMWSKIKEDYKLPDDVNELIDKKVRLFLNYISNSKNIEPIKFVDKLLFELKKENFKLVLASSSNREIINLILLRLKFENVFIKIVSGAELEKSKPDPEIFLVAAELAGSEPENCLVIEDSENGVLAAKRANMKCIGFLNPYPGNLDLSKADIIIRSFDELCPDKIPNI